MARERSAPQRSQRKLDLALVVDAEHAHLGLLERRAEALVGIEELPHADHEAVAVAEKGDAVSGRKAREDAFELPAREREQLPHADLEFQRALERDLAIHQPEAPARER